MKKLLVLALVSSAMVATPAAAGDFGQDAIGWFDLEAEVGSFCLFGTDNSAGNTNNATIGTAYTGFNEADGLITFDIQDDDDNTVQAAAANYRIGNAVCNEAFTVTATSNNGGLLSEVTGTQDEDYTQLVPYTAEFRFDGVDGGETAIAAGVNTLMTSAAAEAGPARLRLRVANSNDLLLAGSYDDFLVLTMAPSTGGDD